MPPISHPSPSIVSFRPNSSIGAISNRSALAWVLCARYTRVAVLSPPSDGRTAITPQHSTRGSSGACATICSTSSGAILTCASGVRRRRRAPARGLPPDGRVQVLDLLDRERVDAAGEVLPAVVGDHEHD